MLKTKFVRIPQTVICALISIGALTTPVLAAEQNPPQGVFPSLGKPVEGVAVDPFERRAEALRRAKREQEKKAEEAARAKEFAATSEESLIDVKATAVVDFWAKSSGGVPVVEGPNGELNDPENSAILGYADVHSTIDTEQADLWSNGQFYGRLIFTFGTSPSDFAGDMQGVTNIDANNYEVGKLIELWYQHEFPYNHSNLRGGMQDVKDRFYQMEYTRLFLNKSLQLDSLFLHAGHMPTYPNTALGITYHAWMTPEFYWSGGVYDGTPGNTDDYFDLHISAADGALSMFETGYVTGKPHNKQTYWRIAVGGWYLKKELRQIPGVPDVSEKHIEENASYNFSSWVINRPGLGGYYLLAEAQMIDNLGGFLKIAGVDSTINRYSHFLSTGLHIRGLIPGREMDEMGMALIYTRQSPDYLANNPRVYIWDGDNVNSAENLPAEMTVEVTYRARVRPWLDLQPNIQFVQSPGMSAFNAASAVMGIRTVVNY